MEERIWEIIKRHNSYLQFINEAKTNISKAVRSGDLERAKKLGEELTQLESDLSKFEWSMVKYK